MNYLAHLHLAPSGAADRVGNLLGDFMTGVDLHALPGGLKRGVELHRWIDRYTDAHPTFRRSRARLPRDLRRFSGVLVDVFYDHLLARHWDRFGDGSALEDFTAACYDALDAWREHLPERMKKAAYHLRRLDWLAQYRSLPHLDEVLQRMSRRSPRFARIGAAGAELRANYGGLERDFFVFFPRLVSAIPTAADV